MEENYNPYDYGNEEEEDYFHLLIERFEKMINEHQYTYFDADEYIDIIDYYLFQLNFTKTNIAIKHALSNILKMY